ncbi:MAG TPA: helix-turn-helix transcriptional regulator [Candidatus Acidoferrales bacterium]|nr:helix-turn-helix transcriptional regulator [Candidatus Acidoferrales bacterium]
MTDPGAALAERRAARGLSLEQVAAATRIRPAQLAALEEGRFDDLAAPVYVRGHLRAYAGFLDLDPEPLLAAYQPGRQDLQRGLALRPLDGRPRLLNLTRPLLGLLGLLLLAGLFAAYAYRQLDSLHSAGPARPSPLAETTPPPAPTLTPLPSASPVPRTIELVITTTDEVWLDVSVDGKPRWGGSGAILPAGSELTLSGQRIKVTSGRAHATYITLDGRELGPMGSGVQTREFSAQT